MVNNKKKQIEKDQQPDFTINKQMEQKISPNLHMVFADSLTTMVSQYDVKIYFGISLPMQDGPEVQNHTIVAMSPQLAKALLGSLVKAVSNYERDFMPLIMKDEK